MDQMIRLGESSYPEFKNIRYNESHEWSKKSLEWCGIWDIND